MTRVEIEKIVVAVLEILDHQYDVEGIESLGSPTIAEITDTLMDQLNG